MFIKKEIPVRKNKMRNGIVLVVPGLLVLAACASAPPGPQNMVKVLMTCKHDVRRVSIDPSLVGDDREMLEDLVAAAFNDAVRRAEAVSQEKMSAITAGMPLPPGMKLPF